MLHVTKVLSPLLRVTHRNRRDLFVVDEKY